MTDVAQTYDVYYMKPDHFRTFILGDVKPKISELHTTHTVLERDLDVPDMEAVFRCMQAENWSPNGEGRTLIHGLGLGHTSMSVGDVIRDCRTNEYYVVGRSGFHKMETDH